MTQTLQFGFKMKTYLLLAFVSLFIVSISFGSALVHNYNYSTYGAGNKLAYYFANLDAVAPPYTEPSLAPTGEIVTALTTTQMDNIASVNQAFYMSVGSSGDYSPLYHHLWIDENPADITEINITAKGVYTQTINTQMSVWVYNFSNPGYYTQIGANYAIPTIASPGTNFTRTISGGFSDFINASGNMYVLFVDHTANIDESFDYVEVVVSYTPPSDAQNPQIRIVYPTQNNTNWSINTLNINYTRSDDIGISGCWYSNDTYDANTTLSGCGNITSVVWADGQHNATIWINDTSNKLNQSSISFTIDTTAPLVNITFPINHSAYNYHNLTLNFTVSDANLQACWKRLNTYNNVTISCTQNTTVNSTGETTITGTNNLTLWANDTFGNVGSWFVTFDINTESPAITPSTPSDGAVLNNSNVNISWSALDINGLSYCEVWTNTTGSWAINQTYVSPENDTLYSYVISVDDGLYKWNIWCNDTINNGGWHDVNHTFTVDTTPPYFTNFANQQIYTSQSLSYNMTAGDSREFGYFAINWTGTFSITLDGNLTNTSGLSAGNYYINVTINDSVNNINSSVLLVEVLPAITDTEYPLFSNFISIPNNASNYVPSQTYKFNVTITKTNGSAGLNFDGTDYPATNVSDEFEVSISDLPAGTFDYYWWAYGNGTNENYNNTQTFYYTINQSETLTTLTLTPSSPITYGTASNFSCSNNASLTITLYLGGVDITSENDLLVVRSANTTGHNISCIATENENYTSSSDEESYIINKATPTGSISGAGSFTYPYQSTVEGTESNTGDVDLVYGLFRNNISVSNPETATLGIGTWIYIYNTTGGQNYSLNSNLDTENLVINQNTTYVLSLNAIPSWSESQGTETTVTGSGCPSELVCNLFLDTAGVSNPHIATLSAGTYNYTYNTTGNENYSSASVSNILTIGACRHFRLGTSNTIYFDMDCNGDIVIKGDILPFNSEVSLGSGLSKFMKGWFKEIDAETYYANGTIGYTGECAGTLNVSGGIVVGCLA